MAPGQPHCWFLPLLHEKLHWANCPTVGIQERPAVHGGLTLTAEADLAVSLVHVSKMLLHPELDWSVVFVSVFFFGNFNTKMQWTKMFPPLWLITSAQYFTPLALIIGTWYSAWHILWQQQWTEIIFEVCSNIMSNDLNMLIAECLPKYLWKFDLVFKESYQKLRERSGLRTKSLGQLS